MDLADIQDWTKETLGPRPASYHRTAIDALAMILNGSESPTAVAVIITAAYSSSADQTFKTGDGERIDRVKVFWRTLCDAARMFGSAHSRLIDLLQEMSTQPDMCATDGSFPKTPAGMVFWRDLPGFPFHLSDDALWYIDPNDHSPDELDEFLEQAPYLLNGTIFAATLFERGFRLPLLRWFPKIDDFLMEGIESPHNDEHFVKAQEWKVLLPVATAWIMIAGKIIYKTCLEDHGASLNLHSKRVWNRSRWELWKEQLRLFENRQDFDEECRGCATRALAKMVEVEEEYQAT